MQIQDPTEETYQGLMEAYDHFNKHLFGGELPHCLITLRNNGQSRGYYSPKRFARSEGRQTTDEIALNPKLFLLRTVPETLSTLVHEMAHLWQEHLGKPCRKAYHDKQWAKMMDSIGLTPSATGEPGAKKTGSKMTHIIEPDGPFAVACEDFLRGRPAVLWGDVDVQLLESVPKARRSDRVQGGAQTDSDAEVEDLVERAPKNKTKYSCPTCNQNVWGKPGVQVVCGICMIRLEEIEDFG